MIRVMLENVALFLLPTAVYFAYRYLTMGEDRSAGGAMRDAPLFALFAIGAAIVLTVLIVFSQSNTAGKPGQRYEPPVLRGGKIEPGRID
jgi:hypothetical protein